MQSQISITYECLQDEIEQRATEESDRKELLKQLQETTKEREILQAKLSSCIEKMSHFSTHVNKRFKTQRGSVQNLKTKVLEQDGNIAEL